MNLFWNDDLKIKIIKKKNPVSSVLNAAPLQRVREKLISFSGWPCPADFVSPSASCVPPLLTLDLDEKGMWSKTSMQWWHFCSHVKLRIGQCLCQRCFIFQINFIVLACGDVYNLPRCSQRDRATQACSSCPPLAPSSPLNPLNDLWSTDTVPIWMDMTAVNRVKNCFSWMFVKVHNYKSKLSSTLLISPYVSPSFPDLITSPWSWTPSYFLSSQFVGLSVPGIHKLTQLFFDILTFS